MNSILYFNKQRVCSKHVIKKVQIILQTFNQTNSYIYSAQNRNFVKISTDSFQENVQHSNNLTDNKESCDTFGNLRKSLEKVSERKYGNIREIRIKSRPSLRKKDDSNIFGKLSDKNPMWYPEILDEPKIDNDQSDDSTIVRNISKQYRDPRMYLKRMKDFVKEKKLKEALELFVEMKRNYVVPTPPHFTFMIGACGKVGYTEMAFKLLRQMSDRKMRITPATLTGLFNSCAQSPFPDYGLKKAKMLREKIENKGLEMTQITYHAMIKAFGRCGDIQTAFQIVDEMAAAKIEINVETFSFLLMSCVEDKESGFTHAIEVWRKMKERKCLPNEFSANLLLRAARDCGIGPNEVSCLLLQHWSNYLSRPYSFKTKKNIYEEKPVLKLESFEKHNDFKNPKLDLKEETIQSSNSSRLPLENSGEAHSSVVELHIPDKSLVLPTTVPSVLGSRPEGEFAVLDLKSIKTSSDRLALLGGARGFLNEMKKNKIKPTIKTFTLLLESLPPYFELEVELVSLLETYNVMPDTGFCNILIKKRILRKEDYSAKQALLLISKWGLTPDILTFGILAMGCRTYNQSLSFLDDLKKFGLCPNVEIVGALAMNACYVFDFNYLQSILKLMQDQDIIPNEKILIKISKTLENAKKTIIDVEHGKKDLQMRKDFPKLYSEFCKFYESWLHSMKFENEENVWMQYKTEITEKYEDKPCKIMPSSR